MQFRIHPAFVSIRELTAEIIPELARPSSTIMNFLLPASFIAGMTQTATDSRSLLTLKRFKLFWLNSCLVKMWCR